MNGGCKTELDCPLCGSRTSVTLEYDRDFPKAAPKAGGGGMDAFYATGACGKCGTPLFASMAVSWHPLWAGDGETSALKRAEAPLEETEVSQA